MKAIFFLLGLVHVLILFASATALTLFVAKRLIAGFLGLFVAKPKRPPVPREKLYTGPLTGPASVRLPQHLRN
jgi:hypothetical protein